MISLKGLNSKRSHGILCKNYEFETCWHLKSKIKDLKTKFKEINKWLESKDINSSNGTHVYTFTKHYFLANTWILWVFKIRIQLWTPKTTSECYLYISPNVTIYNDRHNKSRHVFDFAQSLISTSFHMSLNNCMILSICLVRPREVTMYKNLEFHQVQKLINPWSLIAWKFNQG